MIVSSDWVLPVSRPPIRDGAVLIASRTIQRVGTLAAIRADHPDSPMSHHPGCAIIPGLVNAHTRLSYTAFEGLVPPMPLPDWLERTMSLAAALGPDDRAASASAGALRCIETGATVVGDVANGPESIAAAGDLGLGGVFFWDLTGVPPERLESSLDEREFPSERGVCTTGRLRAGIAVNSPFGAGPGLMRAAGRFSRTHRVPHKIRLAQSPAEVRLLATGEGPFAKLASELAPDFVAPRMGAVRYADSLGLLEGAIAVHGVDLASGEAELLARTARGVVLCPRACRYVDAGELPVAELHRYGARMALGTDSPASNETTDLFAEARALRRLDPTLDLRRLLAILTLEGATVLGVQDDFGSLEPGKQADLVVLAINPRSEPLAAVIEEGRHDRVRAVMSLGMWRFLDSDHAGATTRIEQQRRDVAVRASRELEVMFPGMHGRGPHGAVE